MTPLLHKGIYTIAGTTCRQWKAKCRSIQSVAASLALALAAAAALPASAQDAPATVPDVFVAEIFTRGVTASFTPAPAKAPHEKCEIILYRLDGMNDIEERISSELAAAGANKTEKDARAWAAANEQRIRKEYGAQIVQAANGVTLAMAYRLKHIPAVVLNRTVAVYDTTDVNSAIEQAIAKGALK